MRTHPETKPKASSQPSRPTAPSLASRIPSLRSKGSLRGSLVTTSPPRRLVYESNLEKSASLVLMTDGEVVDLLDQPPCVHYRDANGKLKTHTFDFLAIMKDGRRIAVAVKPAEKAARRNLWAFLERIAPQIPQSFATHVTMVTEADLPHELVRDARLIHAVRRDDSPEIDAAVRRIAGDLAGSATIGSLVEASGLAGDGFRSIVRLIAAGELVVVAGRPIDYPSLVKRADHLADTPAAIKGAERGSFHCDPAE